jgi:hypothetical protein
MLASDRSHRPRRYALALEPIFVALLALVPLLWQCFEGNNGTNATKKDVVPLPVPKQARLVALKVAVAVHAAG